MTPEQLGLFGREPMAWAAGEVLVESLDGASCPLIEPRQQRRARINMDATQMGMRRKGRQYVPAGRLGRQWVAGGQTAGQQLVPDLPQRVLDRHDQVAVVVFLAAGWPETPGSIQQSLGRGAA